jgi:hypothetical protein
VALRLARTDFRQRWPSGGAAATGNDEKLALLSMALHTFALIGGSLWEPSEVAKAAPRDNVHAFRLVQGPRVAFDPSLTQPKVA